MKDAANKNSLHNLVYTLFHGRPVSGLQRFDGNISTDNHPLPKTVEGGGVPQVAETKCLIGIVADKDGQDAIEPLVHVAGGVLQTGTVQGEERPKPFCPQS